MYKNPHFKLLELTLSTSKDIFNYVKTIGYLSKYINELNEGNDIPFSVSIISRSKGC